MSRSMAQVSAVLLAVSGFVGCTGSGGPAVEYVEGVVTLDGQPIEGVTVGFSPVDPAVKTAAVGTTDASGKFKLTAIEGGKTDAGAAAGQYLVSFTKTTVTLPAGTVTSSEDPNYGKEVHTDAEVAPEIKHEVPAKYNNPATSGFKATVKEGENKGDEFKFELTK
ncbi:MAG: hypothetical protein WD872_18425 [Pirellulaceae bacterium]